VSLGDGVMSRRATITGSDSVEDCSMDWDVEGATGAITHGTDSVVTAVAVRTGATENPICGTCRIVGAEVWASV